MFVLFFFTELMSGGELFDRVVEKEFYTENEARVCIMQLVSALGYCHDRGVSHRDLKPENLLYSDATDSAVLKVADFGLAKLVKENEMMQTSCGTPGYVAPEVLLGKSYNSAVDMWSTGVILYILLCGFPPFYDDNNAALFAAIKAGRYDFPSPYWDNVSEDAKNTVRSLLVVNPRERATARALLANPWVAEELPVHETNLKASLAELRKYNMRRKFKAAVRVAGLFNVRQ